MVRHTFKILQQMLQDFESMSDHFGILHIKRLKAILKQINKKLYIHPYLQSKQC